MRCWVPTVSAVGRSCDLALMNDPHRKGSVMHHRSLTDFGRSSYREQELRPVESARNRKQVMTRVIAHAARCLVREHENDGC